MNATIARTQGNATASFKEQLLIFLIALFAYGYFSVETDANANSRLALIKAVVEEHRLEIDSYQNTSLPTSDKALFNNHYYSDKAIGSSLLGLPLYYLIFTIDTLVKFPLPTLVFVQLLTFLAVSLPSALLAPLIYSFTKRVVKNGAFAIVISLGVCLGTPIYAYSTTYYGHSLGGLFLFASFYIWFKAHDQKEIDWKLALLSGLFLGLAVVTEYPTILIAAFIGLYIVYILWRLGNTQEWRGYLPIFVGAAIPLFILLVYNYSIFGNALTLSYSHESSQDFYTVQNTGVMGIGPPSWLILFYMTFHTTMGIFWQSPILLLSFAGWFVARKIPELIPEAILSLLAIGAYFVVFSGYHTWWGGLAFTPRHLIPSYPFFSIPLALVAKKIKGALILLAPVSIGQMFIVAASSRQGLNTITQFSSRYYRMFENSTIYSIYFRNFLEQRLTFNRGEQMLGMTGFASLIPLILLEGLLLASYIRLVGKQNQAGSNQQNFE